MQSDIRAWKQQGSVWLWQYTDRKHGSWHLTADELGVASLISLVQSLRDSGTSDHRTVAITAPTSQILRVPNFQRGDAPTVFPLRWQISCTANAADDVWEFPPELEPASLVVGGRYIEQLIAGLMGILKGEGDYCIGDGPGASLCFWWRITAA